MAAMEPGRGQKGDCRAVGRPEVGIDGSSQDSVLADRRSTHTLAEWHFRTCKWSDRATGRRALPTLPSMLRASMVVPCESPRNESENSPEGDDMASINRRSRDIQGIYAHC